MIKIRPVGAEFFHADGQDERTYMKLTVAFRNFAKASVKLVPVLRFHHKPCGNSDMPMLPTLISVIRGFAANPIQSQDIFLMLKRVRSVMKCIFPEYVAEKVTYSNDIRVEN